jgi:hypothetical protein
MPGMMMTGMMLLSVAALLLYHCAFVVRADGPVTAASEDVSTTDTDEENIPPPDYVESLTSSYKYVTLHNHRGRDCSREIRYNVTFQLDTCINATSPYDVKSFSFYYSINNTGLILDDDTRLRREKVYMISYYDDACSPSNVFSTDEGYQNVEPITCAHGFSFTVSDELPPVTSAASYIK